MKGIFQVSITRQGTEVFNSTFENKILRGGWEHLLNYTPPPGEFIPFLNTVFLGDDDTPVSYDDTGVRGRKVAEIGYKSYEQENTGTYDNPYYEGYRQYGSMFFDGISTTRAEIREIVTGWKDNLKEVAFSRAILRDNDNRPTVAVVEPGDTIKIRYYLFILFQPLGYPVNGTQSSPEVYGDASMWDGVVNQILNTWSYSSYTDNARAQVRVGATYDARVKSIDHESKKFVLEFSVSYSEGAPYVGGKLTTLTYGMFGYIMSSSFVGNGGFVIAANRKYTLDIEYQFGLELNEVVNYHGTVNTAHVVSRYDDMTQRAYVRPNTIHFKGNEDPRIQGRNSVSETVTYSVNTLQESYPASGDFLNTKVSVLNPVEPIVLDADHVYSHYKTGDVISESDWVNSFPNEFRWARLKEQFINFRTPAQNLYMYKCSIGGRPLVWVEYIELPTGGTQYIQAWGLPTADGTGWERIEVGAVIDCEHDGGEYSSTSEYMPRRFSITVPPEIDRYTEISQYAHQKPQVYLPHTLSAGSCEVVFSSGFYGE